MALLNQVLRKTKSGHDVVLCSPKSGDGAELLETVKTIMNSSPHLLTTPEEFKVTVEREEQMITDYLNHPNKIIIIPKVGGKIVGMMDFSGGHRLRISHMGEFGMSVHPDFQGQGIGRLMLEELIKWATAHPIIETIRLKVHSQNVNAVALYKAMNFRVEGREIKGVKLGAHAYDDVICMALDVK